MIEENRNIKVIISGGGTGGHIFPAISIAQAIQKTHPQCEFLFIGAKDKMEMEKIPAAGFPIKGLWISGFQRKLSLKNLLFPFKLISSLCQSQRIIKKFKPDVVVGVGGFASGPTLYMANRQGIPALIQEQNSYPGITNKLLANKAKTICVAYPNMERFFSA
jgi:UDP-N-acetylglucosamine--N-acetylmuramyl-(pentapeptide) pyrophosphoryl-undecaprenol N-acetylglucosamine transferase